MNGKTPYKTDFTNINDNSDNRDLLSPIVTKEIICNSLFKEYRLCIMETGNNIFHPKCHEIKKIIRLFGCNEDKCNEKK